METMIQAEAIPIDAACGALLEPDEPAVFHGGVVDARGWCLAAGRLLRAWVTPPATLKAVGAGVRHLRPALDAVGLELERNLRALGALVDALSARFDGGDPSEDVRDAVVGAWPALALRDDIESALACLEALHARHPGTDDAPLRHVIRQSRLELEVVDAWGGRCESDLALALRATGEAAEAEALRGRFEAMSLDEEAWWLHAAAAARETAAGADWSVSREASTAAPKRRTFALLATASEQRVDLGALVGEGGLEVHLTLAGGAIDATVFGVDRAADLTGWSLRWTREDDTVEEVALARSPRGLVKAALPATLLDAVAQSLVTPQGEVALTLRGKGGP